MPFAFLKYLQPTHYFRLNKFNGSTIFPKVEALPKALIEMLKKDCGYKSDQAQEYDLSWRAIKRGYVENTEVYTNFKKIPIQDEYRFLRKNFHKIWVFYVLCLRLLSLKNPYKELSGYLNTKHIKRDINIEPIIYANYKDFNSELFKTKPLVSVIIPTLNRYEYLKEVLRNLEQQDYKNFEVIIVDQSEPFNKAFYGEFNLNIKLSYQKEKALWLARNKAIQQSKGELILLFDDDSLVEKNWISEHLKCLDYFNADISSGVSISKAGARIPENYSYFLISDQLDTGNVLLHKSVFRKIGLFDRQFEKQRMGDGEFGLRAYLHNLKNISNPYAKRLHLKVSNGGLREMGSWDGFRPKKFFAPRPIPSVLYLFRTYFGDNAARLSLLKTMPSSIMPYKYKRKPYLMLLGGFISILLSPVILIQILWSWNLSSKKIKQGPLIDTLD